MCHLSIEFCENQLSIFVTNFHSSWSWKMDATVSEDYALMIMMMMMMMMMNFCVILLKN